MKKKVIIGTLLIILSVFETVAKPVLIPLPRKAEDLKRSIPVGSINFKDLTSSEQAKIGVKLITEKLKKVSGSGNRIFNVTLALKGKNDSVAAEFGLKKLPEIRQGYAIMFSSKNDALIIGADETGLLYGCVTFSQLIEFKGNKVTVAAMNISDYPYFRYRIIGDFARIYYSNGRCSKDLDFYKELCKRDIDAKLMLKVNGYCIGRFLLPGMGQQTIFKYKPSLEKNFKAVKEIVEYGRKRGMNFTYMGTAAIASGTKAMKDKKYDGMMRLHKNIFTWADDEKLKKRAKEIADVCSKIGLNLIFIHYPDTVNENWVNRGELDRKRFGNDRAKADANLTNVLHGVLKKEVKGLVFMPVVHPYSPTYLRNEYYRKFVLNYGNLISNDVLPMLREFDAKYYQLMLKLYKDNPVAIYYEPNRFIFDNNKRIGVDRAMVETNVRYFKSFANKKLNNVLFDPYVYNNVDTDLLCIYAWNPDAPGADSNFNWTYRLTPFCGNTNKVFNREILLPVCNQNFGKKAGPMMYEALKSGIKTAFLLQPFAIEKYYNKFTASGYSDKVKKTDFNKLFIEQLAILKKADAIVSELAKHSEYFSLKSQQKIFTLYYKEIKLLSYLAPINFCKWEARRNANAGNLKLAKTAIRKGLVLTEKAKTAIPEELAAIDSIAQYSRRLVGRVPCGPGASNVWRGDKYLDQYFKDELMEMEKNLASMKAGPKYKELSVSDNSSVNKKTVEVFKTQSLKLDGKLDEACWQKAQKMPLIRILKRKTSRKYYYPVQQGVAKVVWDDKNIYIGLNFDEEDIDSMQGTTGERDSYKIFNDDIFEIFLKPAGSSSYGQMTSNIAGRQWDCVPKQTQFGFSNDNRWNPKWESKIHIDYGKRKWTVEIKIPFNAFNQKFFGEVKFPPGCPGWLINIGRTRKNNSESSSIVPCKSFHDIGRYKKLIFK